MPPKPGLTVVVAGTAVVVAGVVPRFPVNKFPPDVVVVGFAAVLAPNEKPVDPVVVVAVDEAVLFPKLSEVPVEGVVVLPRENPAD